MKRIRIILACIICLATLVVTCRAALAKPAAIAERAKLRPAIESMLIPIALEFRPVVLRQNLEFGRFGKSG